jgi:hypothetical protein
MTHITREPFQLYTERVSDILCVSGECLTGPIHDTYRPKTVSDAECWLRLNQPYPYVQVRLTILGKREEYNERGELFSATNSVRQVVYFSKQPACDGQ